MPNKFKFLSTNSAFEMGGLCIVDLRTNIMVDISKARRSFLREGLTSFVDERLDRNTAVVFHYEFSKACAPRTCREIMGFMRHVQQNSSVMRSGYS